MRRGLSTECPLSKLWRDFGAFGLYAAVAEPRLTAELDQHAAAVRDSIERDGVALSRRSLTHYLHGFLDGCRERGWDSDSVEFDWETIRLLAIGRMARESGFVS